MGTEFQALRELAGGDQAALKLYQTFKDPHSAFDVNSRQYSFMIGPGNESLHRSVENIPDGAMEVTFSKLVKVVEAFAGQ